MAYGFQHGRSAVAVLNIGGMDDEAEKYAGGIDDDMGFAAHRLLSGVIAANAACLSGLHCTVWLWMTPALGWASRPSRSRTRMARWNRIVCYSLLSRHW